MTGRVCERCGEGDGRLLVDAKTYDGRKIVRCVHPWRCLERRRSIERAERAIERVLEGSSR